MKPSTPIRLLWPEGPLRVAFSVVAFLSALALYFASPRLAESPMLFGIAALLLFAVEVSVFEVAIRRLPFVAFSKAQGSGLLKPTALRIKLSSEPASREETHDLSAPQNPFFRK